MKSSEKKTAISAPKKYKLIVVLTIMMMTILLIISIALSISIHSQLEMLSQLDVDITAVSAQLARISSYSTSVQTQATDMLTQPACGPGLWWREAYLNMNDPSQQCPPAWREYNTSGVRACGRPVTSERSCPATFYFTSHQYSRVCGRVIGYQFAGPNAFGPDDEVGLDGISILYGAQRRHIWSYVAGQQETSNSDSRNCPCSRIRTELPPSYIGDNYYCESGNPNEDFIPNYLYSNDPLWDGQQCEGTCCNGTNSPPWFSVQLPTPTTDIIEVRICGNQGTSNEDTPVELIDTMYICAIGVYIET